MANKIWLGQIDKITRSNQKLANNQTKKRIGYIPNQKNNKDIFISQKQNSASTNYSNPIMDILSGKTLKNKK